MDRASRWWRQNRDKAPTAFDDDMDEALALLRTNPFIGQRVRSGRRAVRRYWLERIGHFIYYSEPIDDLIEISSIWHASRGSRPKL
jgi:plasmid stabilization system protein ParE